MQGKRIQDPGRHLAAEPGDYWKGEDGIWYAVAPCPRSDDPKSPYFHLVLCSLVNHSVEEHEDGTITVQPSILITRRQDEPALYHGFLERGTWRTC